MTEQKNIDHDFIIQVIASRHDRVPIYQEMLRSIHQEYELKEWSEDKHADLYSKFKKYNEDFEKINAIDKLLANYKYEDLLPLSIPEEFKLLNSLVSEYKKLKTALAPKETKDDKGDGKRVLCDCGSSYRNSPQGKLQHERTKKHQGSLKLVPPEELKLFEGFMDRMGYLKSLQEKYPKVKALRKKVLAIKTKEDKEALEKELTSVKTVKVEKPDPVVDAEEDQSPEDDVGEVA